MGEGGAGPAQQLVRHGKKLHAGRTGADLLAEGPPLGCLNTRLYSRSLLDVDFSVHCETSLSPPSLSLSPSPSSLPDLLGHPRGGKVVSHASGDGWGVAVKETTKSIVIDIDEVHEIRVRALLTGGLDQGPHITLKVGELYLCQRVPCLHGMNREAMSTRTIIYYTNQPKSNKQVQLLFIFNISFDIILSLMCN